MSKSYFRPIPFLPYSKSFSELEYPDGSSFEAGDESSAVESMMSNMRADSFLLYLLTHMDERQKIILMYQVLREAGYNLNHADCAKTIGITRERYMVLLKEVKQRASKILQRPLK